MSEPDLDWRVWQRDASESLIHSTSASDEVASAFAQDAIDAGQQALKLATNQRERMVTESLLQVAHAIKKLGMEHSEQK